MLGAPKRSRSHGCGSKCHLRYGHRDFILVRCLASINVDRADLTIFEHLAVLPGICSSHEFLLTTRIDDSHSQIACDASRGSYASKRNGCVSRFMCSRRAISKPGTSLDAVD
jgi:hypothetical protein